MMYNEAKIEILNAIMTFGELTAMEISLTRCGANTVAECVALRPPGAGM